MGFHAQLLCDGQASATFSAHSGGAYADGAWHHATGVFDGTRSRIYVDGGVVHARPELV